MDFSGPAADHPDLQNVAMNRPAGTLNNCAMGYTPWGTYLTCEENFNGYFATSATGWTPSDRQIRYGINSVGFSYFWHDFDPRFDLANPDYANEHNRFGWVVEIDPMDPEARPVKRTALGRKKNEGATVHVADDGHIVVYNGDDESFDYVYKYVSAEPWQEMRANGESPLDRGTLYVGQFGNGLYLDSHGHEKGPHLPRRGLPFNERLHRPFRFVPGEVFGSLWPLGDFCDKFLHRHYEALCIPHSVFVKFFHRPARGSSPGITGLVQ